MSETEEACPLCGGEADRRYHEKTSRHYLWCKTCDLVSVAPEDRVNRESEVNRYLEHDNGFHKTGYVRMLSRFLETAVDPWVRVPQARGAPETSTPPQARGAPETSTPPQARGAPDIPGAPDMQTRAADGTRPRLLDYGCGYAPVMTAIARGRGYEARGWDPFFLPDAKALQETYDVVAACEVMEHVAFPGDAFGRARNLLEPGGIFAVRSSLHPSTWEDFFRFWYIRDRTHISYFSATTVEYCAGVFGFSVELCEDPFWVLRKRAQHPAG